MLREVVMLAVAAVGLAGCPETFECDAKRVQVAARSLGVDTGVVVAAGNPIIIRANPRKGWGMRSDHQIIDANGIDLPTGERFESKVSGARYGALVGWVSNCPDKPFLVGLGPQDDLRAPCDGSLVLAANDNWDVGCKRYGALGCHDDNRLFVEVCIK